MNDFEFGDASENQLRSCEDDLQRVCRMALSYGVVDFSAIEGHRPTERQQMLFRQGKSEIDGVTEKGNHQYQPSRAVDLLPYPKMINGIDVWDDRHRFIFLAGLMFAAAAELGIKIRWGGDWDGDGNNKDSKFDDLGHYELVE